MTNHPCSQTRLRGPQAHLERLPSQPLHGIRGSLEVLGQVQSLKMKWILLKRIQFRKLMTNRRCSQTRLRGRQAHQERVLNQQLRGTRGSPKAFSKDLRRKTQSMPPKMIKVWVLIANHQRSPAKPRGQAARRARPPSRELRGIPGSLKACSKRLDKPET